MASYSFLDVTANLKGPGISIDLGFGSSNSEEGIDIDPVEDKNTMTPGADGEVMHSLHAANTALVTLRYLKTSPTNKLLMDAYNAQKQSGSSWGQNTLVIRNTAAQDLHTGTQVAFKRKSKMGYKKVGDIYEWQLDVGKHESHLGVY